MPARGGGPLSAFAKANACRAMGHCPARFALDSGQKKVRSIEANPALRLRREPQRQTGHTAIQLGAFRIADLADIIPRRGHRIACAQ